MATCPYALIGAGPMGLATARQLSKHDIPFEGFELHASVGGLWDIKNPHSTMYESAHLISSKRMTEFSEFPMADTVPMYPSHRDVCQYFNDYADTFGLRKHYRFSTRVTDVRPLDNGNWQVSWQDDEGEHSGEYAGVLIANGNLHTPNQPALPGQFDGELMHANAYRHARIFEGKRVLIVGCGNSACDIAVDAVHYADSVDLSVRRGYYFLPKFVLGRPIDTLGGAVKLPRKLKQLIDGFIIKCLVGKPSDYGLPDPDYKLYESHPVINSLALHHMGHGDIQPRGDIQSVDGKTVTFSDGSQADYDLILQATGYKLDFPFIDKQTLNWGEHAPDLYLNIFHPHHDNLFVMGMIEATGLGWQGRADQAELVALYLKAQQQNNQSLLNWFNQQRQANHLDTSGGMDYLPLARMAYYVQKDAYLEALHSRISHLKQELQHAG
ncbi:NAD(P)-binding domain-containing protein [Aestuariibacter halophilus]|uniref:NAD(P)-binding domain-containing protein n=1 Tax=Fluctibacter halophilus TaxID=226011 RepID=A0ABS8G6M7_9ALTE|nr:NAD(P)-binding domain-containing protein [Aestuariibacter halophilus]MCC2616178.1 NAD(P)-binding domain-containing protein [Aestuariibacter halophilus]